MSLIEKSELSNIRNNNKDKKIVFCSGCYDILQSGHAVFFDQCKNKGDILIVGVGRDSTLKNLKGPQRPINPENNRAYLVSEMKPVNYVVLNDKEILPGKIDFTNILEELQPDIFITNNDDSSIKEKQTLCDKLNIELKVAERTTLDFLTPTSSSDIINKINYRVKAPLRIDFAGGWTDVPYIMKGKKGFVSNMAISPHVELQGGTFNFSGYPRGSGLSTSTAAQAIKLINSVYQNADAKSLDQISEDLFNLENDGLNWAIGRQDPYSIVQGDFNCWGFQEESAMSYIKVPKETLTEWKKGLLLLHTGISRNAQGAVEQVYKNHQTKDGQEALHKLSELGKEFGISLKNKHFERCADIMHENWLTQIKLASGSTTPDIDNMYKKAQELGAKGKLCGAGGGGAFVFYHKDPELLKIEMKKQFSTCFEIDFEIEYNDIKTLNKF